MTNDWLSLSEAAAALGVHPSTVRSWSDAGTLPVHRTQGGHRRYRRSEIDLWLRSQRSESSELNQVIQNALRNTRFQISEGKLNAETWYGKLDDEAREQYRVSGRTLLQGLINAIISSDDLDIAEADALGYEYASRGNRYGLSSVEAMRAFLFFRNVLLESTLQMFESAAVRSPHAWSEMIRRITQFTDRILVKLLETYELYQRANR
ncbi:MAG: helix-turn-helix protein [Chloroflexi bacterium]|jgi:excisionase family DNA binding protein|nr:helix-turn-helix protein [Chloroflexota bacterium]